MDLIALIGSLDLVNKLDGIVRGAYFTARGRGAATIHFVPPVGGSAAEVESILARYKIPVYGRAISAGHYKAGDVELRQFSLMTVATMAAWAEYVMMRAGVIVLNPRNPHNATWAAQYQTPPPAWADSPRPRQDVSERPATNAGAAKKQPGPAARLKRELW